MIEASVVDCQSIGMVAVVLKLRSWKLDNYCNLRNNCCVLNMYVVWRECGVYLENKCRNTSTDIIYSIIHFYICFWLIIMVFFFTIVLFFSELPVLIFSLLYFFTFHLVGISELDELLKEHHMNLLTDLYERFTTLQI